MSAKARLYLLPTTLGESAPEAVIPAGVLAISRKLKYFIVENERTARRYLKAIGTEHPLDELEFHILDKRTDAIELPRLIAPLLRGVDMGLLSEAGLPAIADPGGKVVALCHREKIRVIPATGPSSIVLALIASGFNGQAFTFHGYLPIDKKERSQKLRSLESEAQRSRTTQIFMETPFRNDKLLEQMLSACSPNTELCIATDITLGSEAITTRPVSHWRKHQPSIHKRPAMFLIGVSES